MSAVAPQWVTARTITNRGRCSAGGRGCRAKSCGATSMMTAGMRSTMRVEASLRNMIFDIASPEAQCPRSWWAAEERNPGWMRRAYQTTP
jgi:hypothetical protein